MQGKLERFYERHQRTDYRNLWTRLLDSLTGDQAARLDPFRNACGKFVNNAGNHIEKKFEELSKKLEHATRNYSPLMQRWLADELLRRITSTSVSACPIDGLKCSSEIRRLIVETRGKNQLLVVVHSLLTRC